MQHLISKALVWYEKYFDTLNRVGVTHECNRRTDRRTGILVAYAALNYGASPKCGK